LATIRVFIPLFNAEDHILETLKSVVAQTYTDWDCVISDDKSTDKSVEIVKNFIKDDSRFKLILNEKHLNVAANWNLSKSQNQSTATKILCSDDVLYPNCLKHQFEILTKSKTSAVFSRRDIVFPNGRKITPHVPIYSNSIAANEAFALYVKSGRNIFGEPVSALFNTRDLLESNGFSELHKYTLDLSGYYEITKNKNISLVNEVVGYFRISKKQWSYKLLRDQNASQLIFKRNLMMMNYVNTSKFEFLIGEIKGRLFTHLRSLIYLLG
jgi:glycosyltransferase involved in cell wall biosynthesis